MANVDHNPQSVDRAATLVAMIARPQLTGCLVWANRFNYFEDTALINTKPFYVRWNDIQTAHAGEGNISSDPDFVGEGEHPGRSAPLSPCVDAGPPDTTGLALPARDLAGRPRLAGGRLDQGCYEGDGSLTAVAAAPAAAASLAVYPNPANGHAHPGLPSGRERCRAAGNPGHPRPPSVNTAGGLAGGGRAARRLDGPRRGRAGPWPPASTWRA